MAPRRIDKVRERWKVLKNTSGYKNSMLFLVFVCVSTLFWFILALNDSAQDHFNVNIKIVNKPDSVTFISDVPEKLLVNVSDKGTNLWRNGHLKHPSINIDFKVYSADGVLRYSYNDIISALHESFGNSASITSVSLDSLQLFYTSNPGKQVPVVVKSNIYPASGSIMEGIVTSNPASVMVYGNKDVLDTIQYVTTEMLTLREVSETTEMDVKLNRIRNARSIPSKVVVTVPIEPLVRKEALVTVEASNVPTGEELLIFPSKVPVEYYVAMSRLNDDEDKNIHLVVDYNDIGKNNSSKLGITSVKFPERLKNLRLSMDSVEYAIVKE